MTYSYYDPRSSSSYQSLCSHARAFAQLADQSIFQKVTDQTTPEQFEAAQYSLLQLCQRLEANMDLFHYASVSGTHQCVRDVYTEAAYRLKHLAIMQPEPLPEPPPKQQLITLSGVVIDLEEEYRTSREETDLGTEDDPPDRWRDR
jgi:hypothetical protein